MLQKEFQFYLDNQRILVERYNGKFLVIKDEEVKGAYDSQASAYKEASKAFEIGTFLIQHCLAGAESYTQTFHSLVLTNLLFA